MSLSLIALLQARRPFIASSRAFPLAWAWMTQLQGAHLSTRQPISIKKLLLTTQAKAERGNSYFLILLSQCCLLKMPVQIKVKRNFNNSPITILFISFTGLITLCTACFICLFTYHPSSHYISITLWIYIVLVLLQLKKDLTLSEPKIPLSYLIHVPKYDRYLKWMLQSSHDWNLQVASLNKFIISFIYIL